MDWNAATVRLSAITTLLGTTQYWESTFDLRSLGMALQVVDDLLDLPADRASGEI